MQAESGPHVSAVQFELDGIIHGLLANRDRKFVYGEMVNIALLIGAQQPTICLWEP